MAKYRIGIDVGGTFTHAVALDAASLELIAQAKVPTTHAARRGVAEGVVTALRALLAESRMAAEAISFLAYSTTQVTNALLEGDVSPVGILATGSGLEGRRAARQTQVGEIALAPGRQLRTFHTFLDGETLDEASVCRALVELREKGAEAIVAAEAFSVDDPAREQMVMSLARETGLPATGTHEISGRYGLRMRTRTAVINASLLPKAIATADLTEEAVREIGIEAPLMVVRSDGGVMRVDDMRRRPLLTLLSGPAAGVAAALMYVRVSDGVFVEVGGTSTDITAIQHGRALLRTAEVGGHRLFLRTLDVRTVGVAGGSMPRLRGGTVADVGPRSAHLAGLAYACFSDLSQAAGAEEDAHIEPVAPVAGDPSDYAVVEMDGGGRTAVTVTCAANTAGQVPEGDFARGDAGSARIALAALGKRLGRSGEEAADSVLAIAAGKAGRVIEDLLEDRRMSRAATELIAGGGGASALAPAVAKKLGLPLRVAPNAPVVSAIGTALAVVRDVVERTVPDAAEADVLQIRKEAVEAAARSGADPSSITVDIEYDARSAVLRAVATGHTELRERDLSQREASDQERRSAAAKSLRAAAEADGARPAGESPFGVELVADSGSLQAYRGAWERKALLGLIKRRGQAVALVDRRGVVRLTVPGALVRASDAGRAREALADLLEESTRYGDAGAQLPRLFLGVRGRIVDLSGLVRADQVLSLAEAETAGLAPDERVMMVAAPLA